MNFPYVYYWHRMGWKGRRCRLVATGNLNSAMIEFENGYRAIVSRHAIRKVNVDQLELAV